MFGGFETTKDAQAGKRWLASTGTSIVIFIVAGGIGAYILSQRVAPAPRKADEIDVTFHAAAEPEPEAKPPPPPPPPPKLDKPRGKRPGKPAPQQVTAIPEDRPAEAEPTGAVDDSAQPEEYGDGGDAPKPAPLPPPPPPPPPRPERIPEPVSEPDPAIAAPTAVDGNLMPQYPEAARKKAIEAEVILKIKIGPDGSVVAVQVLRGEEPFASAARAAALTWHYHPAREDGRPISFVKLVKIPFRIHS